MGCARAVRVTRNCATAAILGVGLSACRGGSDTPAAPPTGSALAPLSLSADPAIATTTTLLFRPALPTPEAATKELWDAWRDNDRPRALHFTPARIVDLLLTSRWSPEAENLGCDRLEWTNPLEPVTVGCRWRTPDGGFTVTVVGKPSRGYRITQLDVGIPDTTTTVLILSDDTAPSTDGTADSVAAVADTLGETDTSTIPVTSRRVRTRARRGASGQTTIAPRTTKRPGAPGPITAPPAVGSNGGRVEVRTKPVQTVAGG